MAERIATPTKTKEIIEANHFYFKKNFGQNFLIDSNILEHIADASGISKEDCVLEIGPGIGSLTQVLAERAGKVLAVEIDKNLIPILSETLKDYSNVEVIHEDILKIEIDQLIEEKNQGRPVRVVANLPYYITTPIVMGLLEKKAKIQSMTVMVQKEVAERMQAKPKEKEYGALSIAVQFYSRPEINMTVPPNCFMPKPKVASAVITLSVLDHPIVEVREEDFFFKLVKCAFGQRRKTLLNSLYNQANLGMEKEELTSIFYQMGLDEKIRGEALSLEQFAELSNRIWEKKK